MIVVITLYFHSEKIFDWLFFMIIPEIVEQKITTTDNTDRNIFENLTKYNHFGKVIYHFDYLGIHSGAG